ncbi:hypothetical protein [Pantoea ananatis]|uniref:hypothetical protein n=1 Tax=Pantoea ananas TaxID=553 RepID=UPI00048AB1D2|nr:hypothetical protein [Pantoea ananatis]
MQSWFFSWKYQDDTGRNVSGWDTVDIPSDTKSTEIPAAYIRNLSRQTGLIEKNIILVAFNKI